MFSQLGPRYFSSDSSYGTALRVGVAKPTDVALDMGKQPTMTPMGLFASRCTVLDTVNVGYSIGSQWKACAYVRFASRGL